MKIINVCGKRGLGDIIVTTGYILDQTKEDTHIIFNYPPGHRYKERFDFIMNEFVMPENVRVTYEVNHNWYTVNFFVAIDKFGDKNRYKTWFFSDMLGYGVYRPFKTQWDNNNQTSIGLVLNYTAEGKISIPERSERLFSPFINNLLLDLVDNKNYFLIGGNVYEPLPDVINTIKKCKTLIGIDTSWAHIANCMRAPYLLCRNRMKLERVFNLYRDHPTLKVIEEEEIFKYLT